MKITFSKYQGTGNDFVLIDNRDGQITRSHTDLIRQLCDRRFGIGADGLILLQNKAGFDFEMVYFNADGNESSMCGNGGRCITAFARSLGVINGNASFLAIDGEHQALTEGGDLINLKMSDVRGIERGDDYYLLDTGSPHYVVFVEDIDDIDVFSNGQAIRYSERFREEGVNVNFVEKTDSGILVATYERGVEGETLSCGTGVVASAIAYFLESPSEQRQQVAVKAKGGDLRVRFQAHPDGRFTDVWLTGPAKQVFEGVLEV